MDIEMFDAEAARYLPAHLHLQRSAARMAFDMVRRERQRMFPILLDIYRHRTRGHNAFKIWFDKEFKDELQPQETETGK